MQVHFSCLSLGKAFAPASITPPVPIWPFHEIVMQTTHLTFTTYHCLIFLFLLYLSGIIMSDEWGGVLEWIYRHHRIPALRVLSTQNTSIPHLISIVSRLIHRLHFHYVGLSGMLFPEPMGDVFVLLPTRKATIIWFLFLCYRKESSVGMLTISDVCPSVSFSLTTGTLPKLLYLCFEGMFLTKEYPLRSPLIWRTPGLCFQNRH